MAEVMNLKILGGGIHGPAALKNLKNEKIGKACFVDFHDADPWSFAARAKFFNHGAGSAISSDAQIIDEFADCQNWDKNPGIKPQPSKHTALDLDFMWDGIENDKKLFAHVVIKLSANSPGTPVHFIKETVEIDVSGGKEDIAVVITQAVEDMQQHTPKGRIYNPRIFTDQSGVEYVEFFIGRSDNPGLINFNIGVVYVGQDGHETPVFIDPGSQNQRP